MSDSPAAIAATFSTWRPVHGRKVLQLVFEVPIEKQGEVLTMLGAPDDKWCAIALMNGKPPSSDAPSEQAAAPQSGEESAVYISPQAAGGHARAAALPPERRAEIATEAANARWEKDKPRRKFETLPLSQQCAIRCGEKQFWEYLGDRTGVELSSSSQAAQVVRDWCTITSRSELDANDYAARIWKDMESAFQSWLTTQAHAETYR